MKRVLVLSDSHGNVGNMIRAVKREEPDMILHLGDCVVDADALRREFPHITMVNVPGNCDFSRGDTERLIDIDGYKVLMCHGHTYGVKMSYMHLELHAKEVGADLALFGHTHKLFYDKHNGLAMMNPGSIGAPLWGCMPSYGIITFDKEHDVMKLDVDYVVKDGEVIIVDEFTGRLMYGRRFNEGLHQAIEAKEGVKVQSESKTLATITFRHHKKR